MDAEQVLSPQKKRPCLQRHGQMCITRRLTILVLSRERRESHLRSGEPRCAARRLQRWVKAVSLSTFTCRRPWREQARYLPGICAVFVCVQFIEPLDLGFSRILSSHDFGYREPILG